MTKPRNKLVFSLALLFAALELLSIAGAYFASYFIRTRLGVLRHVVHLNGKWEQALPISEIKLVSVFVIALLLIFAIFRFFRLKSASLAETVALVFTLGISTWSIYFLLSYNTDFSRAYYILSVCFIAASLFQHAFYHCFLSLKFNVRLTR